MISSGQRTYLFPSESGQISLSTGIKILIIIFFLAFVLGEGYYISVLRSKIDNQTEELNKLSVQLQALRNERTSLHEELSVIKMMTDKDRGAKTDGNTAER